ncbi:hypothetical protein C1645_833540 [Glomus cerebriforme]|uniref:F-box domain-containing protein n=1 Tax=Glomus cerebriforme TaxID=658196 RepID=A0A397SLZ0_9GLOM|nr:hypothetical protein C1645_833540 [Glomus cerebriforme]
MLQLPADCLNEIFEKLEDDGVTLHSCLFVNRFWCEISVRIFWRTIRNYNTLIACLPIESKENLFRKKIITSNSISKYPMFNYPSFCKFLSIDKINYNIELFLKQQEFISLQNLNDYISLVTEEILRLLMSQMSSLKKLEFFNLSSRSNIVFISYPGASECLKDLSELYCYSDIRPEFFYQLSQICHHIQSLDILFKRIITNGLTNLISVQKNLKNLHIFQSYDCEDIRDIITSLTKIPNTLIKLNLFGGQHYIPLSFISKFTNLQEIILSFQNNDSFEDFKQLQNVTFSYLQVLIIHDECPRNELLIKFLEINGKNLKEFYINKSNDLLNIAIIKFCPNLRILFTGLTNNELELLKLFLENLQYLESIKICCKGYFSEKILFDIIIKYSPKTFYELKLNYSYNTSSILQPEELESFLISWKNRIPQKSFSLIIFDNEAYTLNMNDENKEIIKKYIELGVIRNLEILG